MLIYLIRHGATAGNLEKRYVGSTDEPVLESEKIKLNQSELRKKLQQFQVAKVYVSPMRRCKETAEILLPGVSQVEVSDFRECDFGEFEYMNYQELNGNPDYQRFIDTNGECGFPGGETKDQFCKRVVDAFCGLEEFVSIDGIRLCEKMTGEYEIKSSKQMVDTEAVALVVHGGTIMALMEAFGSPKKSYYDWQIKNGEGLVVYVAGNDSK